MAKRRHSARRIKSRRIYDVRAAAKAIGATPATVRHWARNGLEAIPGFWPLAFRGVDIIAFFKKRKIEGKQKSGNGRIHCFRCKGPKTPAGGMVDYRPISARRGMLIGLCPDCEGLMYRACSPAKLNTAAGSLAVSILNAESSLAEMVEPICKPHSEKDH